MFHFPLKIERATLNLFQMQLMLRMSCNECQIHGHKNSYIYISIAILYSTGYPFPVQKGKLTEQFVLRQLTVSLIAVL